MLNDGVLGDFFCYFQWIFQPGVLSRTSDKIHIEASDQKKNLDTTGATLLKENIETIFQDEIVMNLNAANSSFLEKVNFI